MNKLTVTKAGREKSKEKIKQFLKDEFKDTDVTYMFLTTLLAEVIKDIEAEALTKKY